MHFCFHYKFLHLVLHQFSLAMATCNWTFLLTTHHCRSISPSDHNKYVRGKRWTRKNYITEDLFANRPGNLCNFSKLHVIQISIFICFVSSSISPSYFTPAIVFFLRFTCARWKTIESAGCSQPITLCRWWTLETPLELTCQFQWCRDKDVSLYIPETKMRKLRNEFYNVFDGLKKMRNT